MSMQNLQFVTRKQILQDLNQTNCPRPSTKLSNVVEQICEIVQDSVGSKFILCKLHEAPEPLKTDIFNKMFPILKSLMMNRFANTVIQKYFIIGRLDQRQKLFSVIQSNFIELCMNRYGSFVVQTALEHVTHTQLICFIKQCAGQNTVLLAENEYGSRIIQRIIRSTMVSSHQAKVNLLMAI